MTHGNSRNQQAGCIHETVTESSQREVNREKKKKENKYFFLHINIHIA